MFSKADERSKSLILTYIVGCFNKKNKGEVRDVSPAVSSVTAISGAVVTFALAGGISCLVCLQIAMAIDYVTGLAAAVRTGTGLNSNIGFWDLHGKG